MTKPGMRNKNKCLICGLETSGFGTYSHNQKHERENSKERNERYNTELSLYSSLIDKIIMAFKNLAYNKISVENRASGKLADYRNILKDNEYTQLKRTEFMVDELKRKFELGDFFSNSIATEFWMNLDTYILMDDIQDYSKFNTELISIDQVKQNTVILRSDDPKKGGILFLVCKVKTKSIGIENDTCKAALAFPTEFRYWVN